MVSKQTRRVLPTKVVMCGPVQTKVQFTILAVCVRICRFHSAEEVRQACWSSNHAINHNENFAQKSNGVRGGGVLSTKSREH